MQPILPKSGLEIYRNKEDDHAPYRLIEEIIALSDADTWREAKIEWKLSHIFVAESDNPGTCLCGHTPILEHCVIYNRENGNVAVVGNICVRRILGIQTHQLFASLKKIAQNRESALNAEMVHYAKDKGWINDRDVQFCLSTMKKSRRQLSPRQLAYRIGINEKVLRKAWEGR